MSMARDDASDNSGLPDNLTAPDTGPHSRSTLAASFPTHFIPFQCPSSPVRAAQPKSKKSKGKGKTKLQQLKISYMEAMRELWNHELDANEKEAASVWRIISQSKCKVECEGIATLIRHSNAQGPSVYGKHFFVGCSQWSREQCWDHIYWEVLPNIDENTLDYLMKNNGKLPTTDDNINEQCVLMIHPQVGLGNCCMWV
ncbi:hypothetical protein DFH08DRAFT_824983 [Mycena albidolilacea]|uniref:Uncharacterized protein n=1 Tax=Mycena albidolilacea TaxID=1033008 RepID=A0AAD6Z3S4_9AGAR|nr:hypothetical protein DFH08DRAFT_824983 [Mycena albidolilacea]